MQQSRSQTKRCLNKKLILVFLILQSYKCWFAQYRDEREEYERRLLDRHRDYERKILLDNLSKDELDKLMHNKPPVESNGEEEEAPPPASINESVKSYEVAAQPAAAHPKQADESHNEQKPRDKLNQVDYLK